MPRSPLSLLQILCGASIVFGWLLRAEGHHFLHGPSYLVPFFLEKVFLTLRCRLLSSRAVNPPLSRVTDSSVWEMFFPGDKRRQNESRHKPCPGSAWRQRENRRFQIIVLLFTTRSFLSPQRAVPQEDHGTTKEAIFYQHFTANIHR